MVGKIWWPQQVGKNAAVKVHEDLEKGLKRTQARNLQKRNFAPHSFDVCAPPFAYSAAVFCLRASSVVL